MILCCRICLLSDCKLLSLESYGLSGAYEQLTGVTLEHDDGLPRELCVECATLLDKYHKFRDKSIRGDTVLRELYKESLTTNSNINLSKLYLNKPNSNLGTTSATIVVDLMPACTETSEDYSENKIEYNYSKLIEFTNVDTSPDIVDVKNENDIYLKDIIDESNDKLDNDVDDDSNIYNNSDDSLSDEDLFTKSLKIKKDAKFKKKQIIMKKKVKKKTPFNDINEKLVKECFKVKKLSLKEQKQSFDDKKFSEKYLNAVFKCELCYKGFTAEAAFKTHLEKHSKERGEFVCAICQLRFRSSLVVNKHTNNTHQFRYDCTTCKAVQLSSRSGAIVHAQWHRGKKYTCEACGAVFEKNTTYLSHVRIKHPSDNVCRYCGYSFVGEKGVDIHVKYKHYDEAQVPISGPWCSPCNIQFFNDDALQVHNAIKHTQTEDSIKNCTPVKRLYNGFTRKATGIRAKRKRVFRIKSNSDQPNEVKTSGGGELVTAASHSCTICKRQFSTDDQLQLHQAEHGCNEESATAASEVPPGKTYSCDDCGIIYEIYTSYLSHMRIKHPSNNACRYCGYSFVSKKGLELHVTKRHYEEVLVPISGPWCAECNVQFSSPAALQVHAGIKHAHTDKKIRNSIPFVGDKVKRDVSTGEEYETKQGCKKGSTDDSISATGADKGFRQVAMKKKTRGVQRPKLKHPGPCEVCGVEMRSFREYGKHFRRAHPTMTRSIYPGTCICDKCGRKFTCEAVLRDHMLVHGEDARYTCTDCGKKFKTLQQLKNHCLIHQSPSHECHICGLKYNHSGNRNRHIKQVHSDVKDFKCDFCEKRFKTECDKKIHIKHIHLKEPWPKRNRNGPHERQRQSFMRYKRRKETEDWNFGNEALATN